MHFHKSIHAHNSFDGFIIDLYFIRYTIGLFNESKDLISRNLYAQILVEITFYEHNSECYHRLHN